MKRKVLFIFLPFFLLIFFLNSSYLASEVSAQEQCVAVAGDSVAYGDAVFQVIPVNVFTRNLGPLSTYIGNKLSGVKVYNDSVPAAVLNSYRSSSEYQSLLSQKCQYTVVAPFVNDLNYSSPSNLVNALSVLSKDVLQNNPGGKIIIVKYYHTNYQDQVGFQEYKGVAKGFDTGNINSYNTAISSACTSGSFGTQNVICVDPGTLSTVTGDDAPNDIRPGATSINGDQVHLNNAGKDTLAGLLAAQMNFSSSATTASTPGQTQNQGAAQSTIDSQCIGQSVAKYMNSVISGVNSYPLGLAHIKLLSPAFNLTNKVSPEIYDAMVKAGANFGSLWAFAGNTYTLSGVGAYDWYAKIWKSLFGSKPVVFAEFGDITKNISSMQEEFRKVSGDSGVVSALYFNAMGTNSDPNHPFDPFKLSSSEITNITGVNPKKAGVNSANLIVDNGSFPQAVKNYDSSLGWTLEIISSPGDFDKTVQAVNKAHDLGLKPVLRLCIGNSCGFSNPQDLVTFLAKLDTQITDDVYVMAGPNEPEAELWASPECKNLTTRENSFTPKEIPCDQGNTYEDEYHSLRPYPAYPCKKKVEQTALFCGNDLIVKTTFNVGPNNNCVGDFCTYDLPGQENKISINLKGAQLPILGNTELVPNVTDRTNPLRGYLTEKQKVNDYVSWYLNGVINRAESEFLDPGSLVDINNLVNFSGPLRKLLPWRIQLAQRVNTIQEAYKSTYENAGIRHDQTAACTFAGVPIPCSLNIADAIQKLGPQGGFIGLNTPTPWKLTSWLGKTIFNLGDINEVKNIPVEENFKNLSDYWQKYLEWRGYNCSLLQATILGKKVYLCFSLTGKPSFFASLLPFVPFSSTEDRKGQVVTDNNVKNPKTGKEELANTIQLKDGQGNGGTVTNVSFTPTSDNHSLYFAHTEEAAQLGQLLQNTYAAKSTPDNNWEDTLNRDVAIHNPDVEGGMPKFNTYGCNKTEVRTNPGDNLYGEIDQGNDQQISGTLKYDVKFTCEFKKQTDQACISKCPSNDQTCINKCSTTNTCNKDIYTSLAIYTKTPKIQEIWDRLVDGSMSVFKRIFPKIGPGAPIEVIKDIPASTNVTYASSTGDARAGMTGKSGSEAEIYFPHVGGLQEYFLKGIQTALRPKGISSEVAIAGQPLPQQPNQPIQTISCPGPKSLPSPPPDSVNKCQAPPACSSVTDNDIPEQYLTLKDDTKRYALALAGRGKNLVDECFNYVVKRSLDAGINPIYTLSIWVQESAASNYERFGCSLQDMGVNNKRIAGDLDAQLTAFLRLPYLYPNSTAPQCFTGGCSVEAFSMVYQQGAPSSGACTPNQAAIDYANKTRNTASQIAPNCDFPKYPTEVTSCR